MTSATELLERGSTVAVVDARVTNEPGSTNLNARALSVSGAMLVAGSLTNGPVAQIEEAATDDSQNILVPNRYLLLLGPGSTRGNYFLSDAYSGSFVVRGGSAFQQCARLGQDGVTLIHTGITSLNGLEHAFVQAVAKLNQPSSSTVNARPS